MTNRVDLEALDALEREATSAPWDFCDPGPRGEFKLHWSDIDADDDGLPVDHGHTVCTVHDVADDAGEANGRLIAALRNAYPAMAAELRALRDENAALKEDIDILRARAPRSYILTRKEEWLRLFREVYGYLKTCHRQHGTDLAGRDHAMRALIEAQLYLAPEDERAIKLASYHIDLAVEKAADAALRSQP